MEGKINLTRKNILIILYVMYLVGTAGHLLSFSKEFMLILTPYTLLFTGGLVLYNILPENKKLLKWMSFVFITTFLLEVIGVKSGLIFGHYNYGNVLGIKILETPLLIGFNWVLVILGAVNTSERSIKNKIVLVILTAILAVIFDFILEPVAINLGYWSWQGNIIPFQNYAAWFIISLAVAAVYTNYKVEVKSNIVVHYFFIQLVFFMILNLGA